MNYYEHHIGDYAEATAHLTFIEDAAYSRLIRKYYASEKPLPPELKAVQRLVGARTKEEKEAVETILEEFFELFDDGWHNARCDEEIARYQDKQAKAKRSAEARWNKQPTHSEGNANASPDAMRTHSEGSAPRARSRHQTPDTSSKPLSVAAAISPPETPAAASGDPIQSRSIELAAMLRKRGASLQAQDPRVIAWANRGITDAQILTAMERANERRQEKADHRPINAGLLDAILTDIVADADRPASQQRQTIHDQREAASIALTGRKPNHERTNANERDITAESVRIA